MRVQRGELLAGSVDLQVLAAAGGVSTLAAERERGVEKKLKLSDFVVIAALVSA